MLQKTEGDTVADHIARALGERIIKGEIAPGARLRQESVALEFTSSHVPVREAFRRLEARGLVISEPRRGVRVTPLDPAAVREIAEMRAALEVLALRHAAPNFTTRSFERIEAMLTSGDAAEDVFAWETANRAFHRAVVEPCGMPRLLASIDELQVASSRYLFVTAYPTGWRPRSNQDHRLILDALKRRDLEQAATLLRRHILTMERLRNVPTDDRTRGSRPE
ncbi:GntR family transcriptional regulator [Reyranella sp. CPCC 100927]|uniref:GntR family transcriptional regulator n=1 Tax=Reyranella sp. CPCC 100927 TaxID=2599616 RepID=UPI0011B3B042|nr:GntR family transcriptional regulator [Reyranella sp. CPCC 100927]TWT11474.1 GntR family transcriptional regulator [Reyranella sp. CPCC 100927]